MSFPYEDYNPSGRETVNTSFYKNKKNLSKLPDDILNKIINNSNYEDSININHLDRDFNSRYPKSYLQSKSTIIEPHGTIRTYYDDEKTQLKKVIKYRNGVKHGQYLRYYESEPGDTKINIEKVGNYYNDKLEGKMWVFTPDGFVLSLRDYIHGENIKEILYNGIGRIWRINHSNGFIENMEEYYENGQLKYVRSYKDQYPDGKHTKYYENGQLKSDKFFIEGKLNGEAVKWYENGQKKSIKFYIDYSLNGEHIEYYENGQISMIELYKDDELNGETRIYYENGQIKSIWLYEDGNLNSQVEYYENGNKKFIKFYKDDKLNGESIEYYENGEIKKVSHYKDNELNGELKDYTDDGKLKMVSNWENGHINGEVIVYYKNGNISRIANTVYGKYHGKDTRYYENGEIAQVSYFREGKLNGLQKKYYEDGIEIINYLDGEVVELKEEDEHLYGIVRLDM